VFSASSPIVAQPFPGSASASFAVSVWRCDATRLIVLLGQLASVRRMGGDDRSSGTGGIELASASSAVGVALVWAALSLPAAVVDSSRVSRRSANPVGVVLRRRCAPLP